MLSKAWVAVVLDTEEDDFRAGGDDDRPLDRVREDALLGDSEETDEHDGVIEALVRRELGVFGRLLIKRGWGNATEEVVVDGSPGATDLRQKAHEAGLCAGAFVEEELGNGD